MYWLKMIRTLLAHSHDVTIWERITANVNKIEQAAFIVCHSKIITHKWKGIITCIYYVNHMHFFMWWNIMPRSWRHALAFVLIVPLRCLTVLTSFTKWIYNKSIWSETKKNEKLMIFVLKALQLFGDNWPKI